MRTSMIYQRIAHKKTRLCLSRANSGDRAVTKVLSLVLLYLLASLFPIACSAQVATKIVKRGSTLPIYLPPPMLAEANKPSEKLTGQWWAPGPEKFYGYALQDL